MKARLSRFGVSALRSGVAVSGVLIVLVALITLVARFGLPLLAGQKHVIEARLGDYLNAPVSIGSLTLRWRRTGPELRAGDVRLAGDAEQGVVIDEALLDLDVASSLLRREIVVNELTLVGADLVLERAADGSLALLGLSVLSDRPAAEGGDEDKRTGEGTDAVSRVQEARQRIDAVSWLFNARRVGLLDTRLAINDIAGGRRVVLDALDVRVENERRSHRLRIALDLPDDLGGALEIGIDLDGNIDRLLAGDPGGRFWLRADRLELGRLRELVEGSGNRPLSLPATSRAIDAHFAAEIWGRIESGRVADSRGHVELSSIRRAGSNPADDALLDTIAADLRWQRGSVPPGVATAPDAGEDVAGTGKTTGNRAGLDGGGEKASAAGSGDWVLSADQLILGHGEAADTVEAIRLARVGDDLVIDANGDSLDITPIGAVAASLLAGSADAWFSAAAPRGRLADWRTRVRIGAAAPSIDLDARLSGFAVSAAEGLPGIDALNADVSIVANRGRIALDAGAAPQVALDWPAIRSRPLRFDALATTLDVDFGSPGAVHVSGPLSLRLDSATASARITLDVEKGVSPLLDLQGRFDIGDVTDVADALPDRLLPAGALDWLSRAFVAGAAHDGNLLFHGRLRDFPFDDSDGVFRVTARPDDLSLDWLPGWPVAHGIDGEVEVEGYSISTRSTGGQLDALSLGGVRTDIADLRAPRIEVFASGTGPLEAMLDFARTGPLSPLLEPALGDAYGTGEATIDLAIGMPLSTAAPGAGTDPADDVATRLLAGLTVDGSVFLVDNSVRFNDLDLDFAAVSGGVGFTESGVRIHRMKANWLDRPIVLDMDTRGSGRRREAVLSASGRLAAADVLVHYGLPLDRFAHGVSDWDVTLNVPFDGRRARREGIGLELASDLVGTTLVLPAPLAKPANSPRKLAVRTRFRPGERVVRWSIDHGQRLQAEVDVVAGGPLLALAFGLGGTPANPAGLPGVRIDGRVASLDLDGWVEAIAALVSDLPVSDVPSEILPVSADLQADELLLRGGALGAAQVAINSDTRYLNAVIRNSHLDANVRYPREHWTRTTPASVRIARIDEVAIDALRGLSDEEADGAGNDAARGGLDPRRLPPIEARVGRLKYGRLELSDVVLRAEPDVAGLSIAALGFTHESLQLFGSGYWRVADPQGFDATRDGEHETMLDLTLQSSDFGRGLAEIGLDGVLGDAAGRATARVGWPGPAWRPDIATTDGELAIDLERGRIAQLEPGAGRLIGLFAFQALPRRLDLDFSDLVSDGLAFTTLAGEARLEDGVIDSPLVQLTGPIGVIDVTGRTDLVRQQFDQRITVLPRVSAALPIIGAITGGAGAGVGVLLVSGLLKAMGVDFDRIGLREYSLTGAWDDPLMSPVE